MTITEDLDDEDGLDIDLVELPDAVRCVVVGEVTMGTRDQLVDCLVGLLDGGRPRIEIDLSGVNFMDSQGLWALMHARQHAEETDRESALQIVDAAPPVRRLLQMTTVDTLFGYPPAV